jgi:hypothetical protein
VPSTVPLQIEADQLPIVPTDLTGHRIPVGFTDCQTAVPVKIKPNQPAEPRARSARLPICAKPLLQACAHMTLKLTNTVLVASAHLVHDRSERQTHGQLVRRATAGRVHCAYQHRVPLQRLETLSQQRRRDCPAHLPDLGEGAPERYLVDTSLLPRSAVRARRRVS